MQHLELSWGLLLSQLHDYTHRVAPVRSIGYTQWVHPLRKVEEDALVGDLSRRPHSPLRSTGHIYW